MLFSKNDQEYSENHKGGEIPQNMSSSLDMNHEKNYIQKLCNEISEFTPCQIIVFSSSGEVVASSLGCDSENLQEGLNVFDKDIQPLNVDDVVIGYLVISGPEKEILKFSSLIKKYVQTFLSELTYKKIVRCLVPECDGYFATDNHLKT